MNTIGWVIVAAALLAVFAGTFTGLRLGYSYGRHDLKHEIRKAARGWSAAGTRNGAGEAAHVPAGGPPFPPEGLEALAATGEEMSGQMKLLSEWAGTAFSQIRSGLPAGPATGGVTDTGTFMVPFKLRKVGR